jgi:hypothetical protein
MRNVVLFIIAILFSVVATAKCAFSGIWLLSQHSTLNKNGLIVLEFYGTSQALIVELNKKYPIYFLSNKHKITLEPVEILKGEMQVTQVVLKPGNGLIEKGRYRLRIDNLPKDEREPGLYNEISSEWDRLFFTITGDIDLKSPTIANDPVEMKKTFVVMGCGPSVFVHFQLSGTDNSELFVRAKVTNKTSGKITEYILPIENGVVKIGHSMCSGPFLFDNADNYEVSFVLLDQSGNKSAATKSLAFTAPTCGKP